ncbi:MAG: CehA/McbA family metallohydrolase [Deltaproteobacteria bacterium]|nr:CehA/McbA family metallohydrolase [Deltaproteobacteria bacterium]
MNRPALPVVSLALAALVCGCPPKDKGGGGPQPGVNRCAFDVARSPLFSQVGSGATAKVMASGADGVGGPFAQGRPGDVVMQNDKVRVVIQQPGRSLSPTPYGGYLIDADVARDAPGQDRFGKLGFFYAFGRLIRATDMEVLEDGANGGAAVVAVTGEDAVNDAVSLQNVVGRFLPGVSLVVDANQPVPLRATTYYVLSPGESRVRVYTQFCNEGPTPVQLPLGELVEQGGTTDFFNPDSCANRPGTSPLDGDGCTVDPVRWFGYQGDGVAYGLRTYQVGAPSIPETKNALISVAGVAGMLVGGEDLQGLLSWADPGATRRPGAFAVLEGGQRGYLRDFVIGRDLGEVHSTFLALDSTPRARLEVQLDGPDAAHARVAVKNAAGKVVVLLQADASGKAKVDLEPGPYSLVAAAQDLPSAPVNVTVQSSGTVQAQLQLPSPRQLVVNVKDAAGAPGPAKVTVFCAAGLCPNADAALQFRDGDRLPSDVAAVAFVSPTGSATLKLLPGTYSVVVTRGPEFNAWPFSWKPGQPGTGATVDLSSADATLEARLDRVVDSAGWMSADLHVHAVNSADSSVENEIRVTSFLAEGVDILCSTDHDFVTDYAPVNAALGGEPHMATIVGEEISTFDFGHYNAFPLQRNAGMPNGGAVDWPNGEGPTFRLGQLFERVRADHPEAVVQFNHPRGRLGGLSFLEVDTLTGASHAPPAKFRMEADPSATEADTKLFSFGFDAVEIVNGTSADNALLNDYFTWLSSGWIKTATGVSDTHEAYNVAAGYSRTFLKVGTDDPRSVTPGAFAAAVKSHAAVASNGPFVRLTARKKEGGVAVGAPVDVGGTLSVPAGGELELTVDVQGPEWMVVDRVSIFTHAAGREALGGVDNETPPTPVATASLDAPGSMIEAVPGLPADFRRFRWVSTFTVAAQADTWFVATVRGGPETAQMFPLAWTGTSCSNGRCTPQSARPAAWTNAVFVDADGSGAYDNFPTKIPRSLRMKKVSAPVPARVPSAAEFDAMLRTLVRHEH